MPEQQEEYLREEDIAPGRYLVKKTGNDTREYEVEVRQGPYYRNVYIDHHDWSIGELVKFMRSHYFIRRLD